MVEKKKIWTAAIGNMRYFEVTIPRLRAYANCIGAELQVLHETKEAHPQQVVLDVFRRAAHEPGRHVWLDADILPHVHARDIFQYLDFQYFWGCAPFHLKKLYAQEWIPWLKSRYPEMLAQNWPYLNTCMMGFTDEIAAQLEAVNRGGWPRIGDQEIVNLLWRWAGLEVRGVCRNLIRPWKECRSKADFYHCGGKGKLRKLHRVLNEQPIRNGRAKEPSA